VSARTTAASTKRCSLDTLTAGAYPKPPDGTPRLSTASRPTHTLCFARAVLLTRLPRAFR
jgi:hypothetical protein